MTATATPTSEYLAAPNRVVSAANGVDYAYRQVGEGTPALVLLQHFRGNLDNWDPALVDALAHNRRVVTFDNAGVGGSTGTTPSTIAQMARDAITFIEVLKLGAVDLLGFSIGSFQEIALIRPAAARRLVLACLRPRAAIPAAVSLSVSVGGSSLALQTLGEPPLDSRTRDRAPDQPRLSVLSQVFTRLLWGRGATLRRMNNNIKKFLAAGTAAVLMGVGVAGFTGGSDATSSGSAATTAASTPQASTSEAPTGGGGQGGVSAASVTTEAALVDLIQEAYGDASLGLHRGHQDVESTLIDVLGISHGEMHVRMETQGQNLAAVATDLGIDPQTLIDALVDAQSPAIDTPLENGSITQAQADAYLDELEKAYTFRVTGDGQEATPTAEAVS